jgi:hypothetical protein
MDGEGRVRVIFIKTVLGTLWTTANDALALVVKAAARILSFCHDTKSMRPLRISGHAHLVLERMGQEND